MSFREALATTVTLRTEAESASSEGGNIKEFELRLELHGFRGRLRMWVIAEEGGDAFFPLVCTEGLLQIEMTVVKALYKVDPAPAALKLVGVVTARRLREVAAPDVTGSPVLYREYSLEFCDTARALWSEHHPCAVYAKASIDSVVKANTPGPLTVQSSWPLGKRIRPMICLGLGQDEASFYDFVFWLADTEYGHVWYDYAAQRLVLDAAKPSVGPERELAFGAILDTTRCQVTFAAPRRAAVQLLNSWDTAQDRWDVQQPNAVPGVRRDYMVHTPIDAEVQARQSAEQSRHGTGKFDVRVTCDAYPEMYIAPGSLLSLANELSGSLFVSGSSLRVLQLELSGVATHQTPEFDIENTSTDYDVTFTIDLEPDEDPRWRGPLYRAPRYPLRVEGKMVSAVGDDGDRAYTVYAESDATDSYHVSFALWNSTISIDMTPDFMPGHLYFPVYKNSRVLVALELESARIDRFLDWGKDVTVPSASLGNHLLLGKNQTSETSIKHWYVDNSPQLVIGRVHSGDMGTLTVKEGTLTLELTDENGASGFAATTSVEPQAQLAKAEMQQKSDLAVADLQNASASAEAELTGSVVQATTSLRQQSEQLASQVRAKSKGLDQALADVGASIDAQAQQAESVLSEARQRAEGLLR